MNVHIRTPYSVTKDLAKAYNESMATIPEGDAACFIDYDVMLLHPESGRDIHEYANRYPNAMLTCYTNRVSELSRRQLLNQTLSLNPDVRHHISLAETQRSLLYQVSPINRDISGMLMVIPKSIWNQHPFNESRKCLGVDTDYGRQIREAGIQILRMNGVYVFHIYRLGMKSVHEKSHLR